MNVLPPVALSGKAVIRECCTCTGTRAVVSQQSERHSCRRGGGRAPNFHLGCLGLSVSSAANHLFVSRHLSLRGARGQPVLWLAFLRTVVINRVQTSAFQCCACKSLHFCMSGVSWMKLAEVTIETHRKTRVRRFNP